VLPQANFKQKPHRKYRKADSSSRQITFPGGVNNDGKQQKCCIN